MACVIYLFSMAGKVPVPAFGSPCKELEQGGFMSKAFKFVQFLQVQGGWLSNALQADPSPLPETLQPLPPGSCWTEEVMGAVTAIFDRKTWFFKEYLHISRQVQNSSVGF